MRKAALIFTPEFNKYDFGPNHPLRPIRVVRTYDLIRACGFLHGQVIVHSPSAADENVLALVHSRDYIDAVRAAAEGNRRRLSSFGLGTIDNPIVEGIYDAAALIAGASVAAVDLILDGKADVAFNPGGGLHHAHRSRAAGFCIFNDPAIAIAHLLKRCNDAVKVAYLDIDAHHGDGVQEAFYHRNDVLTISIHESGRYLFPMTGEVEEIGAGEGLGYSVNFPLSPYTTDEVYCWAFRQVISPLLESFAPDFVVAQLGVDMHYQDPLTHLCCTTHGYNAIVEEIARYSSKWIAVGGGGYDITVVPRAWTLAFAQMISESAPEHIPESELRHYRRTDGPAPLHDENNPVLDEDWKRISREFAEESVERIKNLVFPYHGL